MTELDQAMEIIANIPTSEALPLVDCDSCGGEKVARAWLQKHQAEDSTILVKDCPVCELAYSQTL